jgi:hypothetical protein
VAAMCLALAPRGGYRLRRNCNAPWPAARRSRRCSCRPGCSNKSDAGDRYRRLLPDCHFIFVCDAGPAIGAGRPAGLDFIAFEFFERDLFLVNREHSKAFSLPRLDRTRTASAQRSSLARNAWMTAREREVIEDEEADCLIERADDLYRTAHRPVALDAPSRPLAGVRHIVPGGWLLDLLDYGQGFCIPDQMTVASRTRLALARAL